jgi:IS30 family transposase
VSHEAIYALPRGELRRALIGYLRHAKPARGRKSKGSALRGKLYGMTNIKDRPKAVADSLNARPRNTLDFATPGEHFSRLLAGLAGEQMKPSGDVRSGT